MAQAQGPPPPSLRPHIQNPDLVTFLYFSSKYIHTCTSSPLLLLLLLLTADHSHKPYHVQHVTHRRTKCAKALGHVPPMCRVLIFF